MKPYRTLGVRNQTFLDGYALLDSYRNSIPGTKCIIEKALVVSEGPAAWTCYHIDDRKRLRILLEKELRNGIYTKEFFAAVDKYYKYTLAKIKEFSDIDLSKATAKELVSYFETYYQIYITTFHPMVWAIYASDLQNLFESELHKVVGKLTKKKLIEYTALLLTPTRLTTVQKEEQVLFEIQDLFEHQSRSFSEFCKNKDIMEKLNILERFHGWFHMEYIGEPWKVDDYKRHMKKRIQELKEGNIEWKDQKSPKERLALIKKQQKEFLKKHNCSDFFKNLIFALQEFSIVLDFSKADLVEGFHYARPLLTEIGKRTGSGSWIDVRYNTKDEIKDMLLNSTKLNFQAIKERKAYRTIWLDNNQVKVYQGKKAMEVADKLMVREKPDSLQEVKGTLAYPGKVQGRVKIVTSSKDMYKFEKGNIMVTRDTTTELTSIIKKSAAIVADQGTLLSHTATVAREFKIPCIILTQIGTQVFKDGDLVEVDAEKGIVRKI